MNEHWSNFCKLSIVHFMIFPDTISGEGPILQTVTQIAEDPFFGAIEMGMIKDREVRGKVKKIIEISHLQASFGAQPALLLNKLNLNSLDESERKLAVDKIRQCVDEAEEIGAKRIAFLSGRDPGDADRPMAYEALVRSVSEICEYSNRKNISVALETFDRTIDKKCLIGPSDYSAKFAARVREEHPDFGLLYDLSHMPLLSESPETSLSVLKDYLVHIHVGNGVVGENTPGYGDLHPRFGWPGGSNDVPELVEFIQMLFKIGYLDKNKTEKPWVGFEVKPLTPEETPELVIANTKRVWQEAWSLV